MPSSCTIYRVVVDTNFNTLCEQIEQLDIEIELFETPNQKIELETTIEGLECYQESRKISGTIVYDYLQKIITRDKTIEYFKATNWSNFDFVEGGTYLIVHAPMKSANIIAIKLNSGLNRGLFRVGEDLILNCKFTKEGISEFLSNNPHIIKRCTWRGLDIPGITTATLGGPEIRRSPEDVNRYESHGHKGFVMMQLNETGWIISLSEDGNLVFYSKIPEEEKLKFITKKIFPITYA